MKVEESGKKKNKELPRRRFITHVGLLVDYIKVCRKDDEIIYDYDDSAIKVLREVFEVNEMSCRIYYMEDYV
ncbi:hypothetical protein [Acidianus sulfidivorans]|uniref:Uncharacterized protein n=1 Tax=Acidianus sulfidivorans JP7 TaxID=619593 RepID=A0A2U9IQ09_9CREN|nr:hypothetical protein [Acidianus sulfidivorans]